MNLAEARGDVENGVIGLFDSRIYEHYLCWDEENRLSATRDQYYATANIYDASGNRAWKLGGELNWMWNNGQGWQAYGDLNLRTWYQSDLVTITDQAMTKHYFIAGQRIASKLVESLVPEVSQNLKGRPLEGLTRPTEASEWGTTMTERLRRDFDCLGIDYNAFYPGETRLQALEELQSAPEVSEYQVFFYHSDHLGSSSFITDANGDATQHLQYLPFGEDLVHEQNTAAYLSPYTFSGKERDVETSLSYFGARYYEAGLSIWLSVDPLSEARPYLSPYNYCQLNPVMLVDPTGMLDDQPGDLVGEATSKDGGSKGLFESRLFQKPGIEGIPEQLLHPEQYMLPSEMKGMYIAGNPGGDPPNTPTREKGGFIKDKDAFYEFMKDQAKTNPVEVAAWELIDPKGGGTIFYVQPWENNSSDESYNNPAPGFENSGSSYVRQIHTHPGSNRPGYTDASLSSRWGVPIVTIGANGNAWEVSYPKNYAVPRGMLYGKQILID